MPKSVTLRIGTVTETSGHKRPPYDVIVFFGKRFEDGRHLYVATFDGTPGTDDCYVNNFFWIHEKDFKECP